MKFIRNFLGVLLILLMASSAWAASSIVGTVKKVQAPGTSAYALEVALVCTAHVDGVVTAETVQANISNLAKYPINGLKLHYVQAYPGGTAPTDGSDLTLTMNGVDILGGRGTDLIDATSYTSCAPGTVGAVGDIVVTGNITINISNIGNAGITNIILTFVSD